MSLDSDIEVDMATPPRLKRDQTREKLLNAARKVLAEAGYASFGVNAVAREAGCDKVLIYRYFGGAEGLAEALGQSLSLWLPLEDPPQSGQSYAAAMGALLASYLSSLRQSPIVKRVLCWELQETNELTAKLGAAKSLSIQRWFQNIRSQAAPPPPEVDAPAINAILIAAAHHLALREDHDGSFAGLDLKRAETWSRLDAAFTQLTSAVYAMPPSNGKPPHA